MTRLLLSLMRAFAWLPLPALRAAGAGLGWLLHELALPRRRVARTNLEACFPGLSSHERADLVRQTFRLFGQGFLDRAWLWHASPERIRARIRVTGMEHLSSAEAGPVILLAPHFVGLDAAWTRLTLDRRMATIYANQNDPAFNAALKAGRARFNEPVLLSRQDGVRAAFAALRQGMPLYYLPDMDFGARDAVFVSFFGVPAATVTALPRLARLAGARVVPCITRLTPTGYVVTLHPAWPDFPGSSDAEDVARVNAFIERMVETMPAQYHWLHKRFKTRPPGTAAIY
jgi:KDO2-lipid IV(A) lauroyltransferase